MKTSRIVIAVAVALCAAQAFSATHTEVTTAPRLPFLRGMGFDGYYENRNYSYMTQAGVYTGLVAKGFDHVRLPIDFRKYATYDSSTGVATLKETTSSWWSSGPGFKTFDTVITNAINAGLYIILDFHGWFDIDPTNTAHTAQFIALWKAVAERYKDYPNQLIFELANEPRSHNFGKVCTMQKNAITEIRKTNPTRLILFDPADASQPWVLTQCANPPNTSWVSLPASDNNIAVVVHSYNPGYFTHQGESWSAGSSTTNVPFSAAYRRELQHDLDWCKAYMDVTGVKLVMNEFNVSHKLATHSDVTDYLSMVTRFCESNKVPWAPWIYYANGSGFDCFSGYGANASMHDFIEAGLFPTLKTTDKFSASDYPHKIEITFSGYAGSSALADFPVLVKLSESLTGFHYSDFTRADGFDLCFTDSSGNLIPHEIDTWNPGGVSTVWVKVPSLTASTKIVARYGCAKPIVPKVGSVWDSNYVAVWHMGEPKLPLADSSNVSRDLTAADGSGIDYGVSGVAGGAVDFGSSGGSRGLFADDHANLDGHAKLTVEAWTYQKTHGTNAGIVSKRKGSGNQASYYLYDNGSTTTFQVSSNGAAAVASGVNLAPVAGRWNHQAYTIDTTASANNAAGYLDGTRVGTATAAVKGPVFAGTGELCIGNLQSGNAANFPGRIDEVRVSKCVRSADWVKASYDTVAKASFATYAVDGVVSTAAPEEQGANLVPTDVVEYNALDMDAFAKKVSVTFSGYSGSALANFPVLVKLSTAISGFSYADFQKPKGGDLRFADANGTLLPHEIDTWNPNGVSTVWVKVPSLSANGTITACYGCANPPAVAAKDVWDEDYVGVWHLGESALPMKESSETSADFTQSNGNGIGFASQGIVGGSVDFGESGKSRALIAPDHNALDGFTQCTFEAWTYVDSTYRASGSDVNKGFLSKRINYNNQASYYLHDTGSATKFFVSDSGTSSTEMSSAVKPDTDTWTHQAYTFDGTTSSDNVKGWKNGANVGTASKSVSSVFAGSANLVLGNFSATDARNYPGRIDELRISKVVRSGDWIKATHDTIVNADFATYAVMEEESPPEPQTVEYGPLATSAFAKSMSIRFDVVQAGATLTNFPVLVKLSTAIDGFSYADFQKANGGDLRFADPDGNLVPHEIDTWDESGVSTVWVKIPRLTRNTIISAYYGCANPPLVAAKDVWDDDYVGVWHLGESALPMKESSETSSNFTNSYGSTIGYAAPGIVGGSVDFPTNGTYNALVAPDHDALDGFAKFTLEAWTFQNEHKNNAGILSKRKEYNNECAYYIYDVIGDSKCVPFCIGTNQNAGARWSYNMTQPMGQWNHIAFTADMVSTTKNVHGYMNGAKGSWEPDVEFLGEMGNCACDLYLGNLGANKKDYSFNGKIDEVRISKCVRSTAWLKATYDTIANSAFATYAVGTVLEPDNIEISEVKLKARTDKDNPIDYVEGEPIRFDFWLDGVEALPAEIRGRQPCYVIWTRTADDGVTVKGTNTISLTQGFSVTTSLAIPGIVKMTGTLVGSDYKAFEYYDSSNSKKNVTFGGGAGVATEKMQLSTVEPADFDQFWAEAKAKLDTVPFVGNVELVDITPSGAENNFTIYAAKVPCFGPRPVTGWVTIPKKVPAGGLPIQASFDGYGCATAIPKAPTWGYSTNVHFHINAHGYDVVNRDNKYYQDFSDYINKTNRTFNGTTYGYALAPQDYDNPTNTYFYYMAMRVMRAFQYLKSRPEWNGRDVIASGGSQGGLQTMWAGGLVDGITEIKPSITWGCDIGCPFNGNGNPYPSRTWGIPSVPGAYYFDSALHARRVPRDCIANITRIGMGDYTCPPRGVLLSYYNMKCAVSAYLVQGSDHGYSPPPPNQTFTISKEAAAAPASVFASDAAGFDYTNRVVTVTNATVGATLTLTATASDGTTTTATATVDENGEATFDIATSVGKAYDYTVAAGDDTVVSGGFFTGGWDDGGTWFSAAATNGVSAVSGGDWQETPTVAGRKYAVDGTADFVLSSDAAAAGSNRFVRVDFDYVFNTLCDAASLSHEGEEAIGGFTAAVNAKGDKLWMAYGDNGWVSLYGDIAPTEEQEYVVRAEADFAADSPRVRYEVSADAGAAFAPLYIDEGYTERWVTGAAQARSVTGVEFDGQGSVASLFGSLANANVAEADGVGYALLADALAAATNSLVLLTNATWPTNTPVGTVAVDRGDFALTGVTLDGDGNVVVSSGFSSIPNAGKINISLAQVAALGVTTAGRSPAQIAEALAANGANGIPIWESYVLGLDPTKSDAKPKAMIVMNGDQVELALVGIDVNEAAGATVSYKVYKSADLSDLANVQPLDGDHALDEAASLQKSASEPKMFYRLVIDVKGY